MNRLDSCLDVLYGKDAMQRTETTAYSMEMQHVLILVHALT